MSNYFMRWCNAYEEYIEEWYRNFIYLYNQHGYYWDPSLDSDKQSVPTRKEFYEYCYQNTIKYWDKEKKTKLAPIVMTPRKEEKIYDFEQQFISDGIIR